MPMNPADAARSCVADALEILEHLTTDEFSKGGDRTARELLVEAVVALGSPPATWMEYPEAVARGMSYRPAS